MIGFARGRAAMLVLAFAALLLCFSCPATARAADPAAPAPAAPAAAASKSPAAVLSLDSEDMEDQAEALSGALRSKVRTSPNFTMGEGSTSLSLLVAALKCPTRPDAACLQRIGDQLKVDTFFWGTLAKSGPRQVTAEVHLWARGKADVVAKESFSDNLRDQNDEVLKRIAARIFDKLTGAPVAGLLTVRAGESNGSVLVDGAALGSLEHGQAVLELKPGSYSVEVRVPGYKSPSHRVVVAPGADLVLNLTLVPEKAAVAEKPSRPISGRTILTLGILAVGVGFGVAGTVEGVSFLSKQSKNDEHHKTYGANDFCDPSQPHSASPQQLDEACQNLKDAKSALALEAVFYSISAVLVGTGVVLLITDRDEKKETAGALKVRPHGGLTSAGLDLKMAF
jgi:hypothetical protein